MRTVAMVAPDRTHLIRCHYTRSEITDCSALNKFLIGQFQGLAAKRLYVNPCQLQPV